MPFEILLTKLAKKLNINPAVREKSVIVIEVENEILGLGDRTYQDAVTVIANYKRPHNSTQVSVTPSLVTIEGRETIYHYLIYDLCQVDEESSIDITIRNNGGRFSGYISVRIDKVEKFEIICPN